MPGLVKDRSTVPLFVESMIALIIAWHEDFLSSLVAQATRARWGDPATGPAKRQRRCRQPASEKVDRRAAFRPQLPAAADQHT